MAEVEVGGIKFRGGKIFVILTALTTAGGALWGGFEFYKDYLTMKEQIQEYVAPDLSEFDKNIALTKEEMDSKTDLIQTEVEMLMSEMEMMMQEIRLVADVANELKNDLRQDVRRIEKVVNDVEQMVKEDSRETSSELRDTTRDMKEDMELLTDKLESAMTALEEKIEKRIKLALDNPLSQMK
jgi:signal transduction histidine kinase